MTLAAATVVTLFGLVGCAKKPPPPPPPAHAVAHPMPAGTYAGGKMGAPSASQSYDGG